MRLPCFALRAVRQPSPDVIRQEGDGLDAGEDVVAVVDSGTHAAGNALQVHGQRDLPDVCVPTAAEVARHNPLHLTYKRWFKICVACRWANATHFAVPPLNRGEPLLVLDYGFPRDGQDQDVLTVCVARVYPLPRFGLYRLRSLRGTIRTRLRGLLHLRSRVEFPSSVPRTTKRARSAQW